MCKISLHLLNSATSHASTSRGDLDSSLSVGFCRRCSTQSFNFIPQDDSARRFRKTIPQDTRQEQGLYCKGSRSVVGVTFTLQQRSLSKEGEDVWETHFPGQGLVFTAVARTRTKYALIDGLGHLRVVGFRDGQSRPHKQYAPSSSRGSAAVSLSVRMCSERGGKIDKLHEGTADEKGLPRVG